MDTTRRRRGPAAVLVSALALASLGGCSGSSASDGAPAPASDSTTTTSTAPSTSTTVTEPVAPVDQAAPTGTNGMAIDAEGRLWVADLDGGEILAVDPEDGTVLHRYGADAGVEGPDDLAFDVDGRLWWTSFTGGFVGRIDEPGAPGAVSGEVAELGTGPNPIVVSPDGRVFVGRALTGRGLYELDPADVEEPRVIAADPGELNGFEVGADGRIYAPQPGTNRDGTVVAIDPERGAQEVLATGLTLNVAAAFDPDGELYVLVAAPVQVFQVDQATGALTPFATPASAFADNLVFAPDGTLYVSAFDAPTISVIAGDGTVTTITVGGT